ncbi:MAG: class I SAM-dependent methyltransferase family protein, partial [Candidatus Udaeobacter sp.]
VDEVNVDGAVIARRGDAFNRESLAGTQPRPTIGIVSGLYELFPSNGPVLNSLRGLAGAIEPGGYLIYTNQPWHPQLEFIAHVLVNREGERWIMRRRTTAEMDELVRVAGFEKIEMEIDEWGMFSVSVARRGR